MIYTVHWPVNDGRDGYPNIVADLNWTEQQATSYAEAIGKHADQKGVVGYATWLADALKEVGRGKVNGTSYRDFVVRYLPANAKDRSRTIEKTIRVFARRDW